MATGTIRASRVIVLKHSAREWYFRPQRIRRWPRGLGRAVVAAN